MTVRNHEGMRKDGGRMYSDSLGRKTYDNKQAKPKKDKVVTPPTKVVVRYLPASMTEEEFQEAVSPLPENDYFCFMNADLSLGPNAYCRAYINFKNVDDVFIFRDKFDGYVFVDQKGNEYPAMVEFAPFQKIPKRLTAKKKDARCGTIDNDPDYLSFLELLNNPEPANLPAMEAVLEEIEAHDRELQANNGFIKVKTPLLEFIEHKKAEKLRSKEERKEERRRKEFERKKAREDERRKKKDYKDPRKKDDYKDESSAKVKLNVPHTERGKEKYFVEGKLEKISLHVERDKERIEREKDKQRHNDEEIMRDERKTEKIIEEKLEKLSLRIGHEEKERGKTEKIIESKIEKISSRIEREKERIEVEKERQRKSEEIRLDARRQRDRDSEFRRDKEKKNRKQMDDEQNDKLKDEEDIEGKSEKISRIDKERERLEREKERQKRSDEIRQEARKLREKERERREKERQLRKEKEREERLKRQEEKAKIRAEEKSRYKDEYRDDYYEDRYYNTSNVKAEGAKTKRYSEGRRKEERERRLKEEREREKRMREADKETKSLEGKSNESLTIPKEDTNDKYEDNISGDKNDHDHDHDAEENKSSIDGSTILGSDGNKSGGEDNKSGGEQSKYEDDGNKSGSEENTMSKEGGDDQDDNGKRTKDPRTERRIRNKDRPTMAIYRPGQSRLAQSRMAKSREDNPDVETSSSSPSPVMPSGDGNKEGTNYKDTKDSRVKCDKRNKDDEDKKCGKSGKVGSSKVIKYSERRREEGREDDYDDRISPEGDEFEDVNKDSETKKYGQKIFRRSVSRE